MAKDLSDVQTTVAVVVGGEKNRGDQSERTHQDEGACCLPLKTDPVRAAISIES